MQSENEIPSENQNQWQAEKRLLFNAHIKLTQVNLKKLACSPSKIITIYYVYIILALKLDETERCNTN